MARHDQSFTTAPLDRQFQPAMLFNRNYLAAARNTCRAVPLVLGLERENGLVSRHETLVLPDADVVTTRYVERLVKFLLWSRGGARLHIGGPKPVSEAIRRIYAPRGARSFDWQMMTQTYNSRFHVIHTSPEKVPAEKEMDLPAGSHRRGYRVGFDLSSTRYKVSAVANGKVAYLEEAAWDPKRQPNPDYHYHLIAGALHRAASHLKRVDAIGVSCTGIIVDNRLCVTSLFRAVPRKLLPKAGDIFKRIEREWQVPLVVMNDGDVATLAGALSLGSRGMLGVAMDVSEAAGYMDREGRVRGWLNELAFVPVDYNPEAPADAWSGDRGTGMMYFSQQAVNKLMPAAGIVLPRHLSLTERVAEVQAMADNGDARATKIFETIGVYLGYAVAHWADFYDFDDALILGQLASGKGGLIAVRKAQAVLKREFPELSARVQLRTPDNSTRRVEQAVAAASLPPLRR